MARVSTPEVEREFRLDGTVNGRKVKMVVDTGAKITTVPSKWIEVEQYTGEKLKVSGIFSGEELAVAVVPMEVRGVTGSYRVVALETPRSEVLLGLNHPLLSTLSFPPESGSTDVHVLTRTSAAADEAAKVADLEADRVDSVVTYPLGSVDNLIAMVDELDPSVDQEEVDSGFREGCEVESVATLMPCLSGKA